ncbi:MAG TPA: TAT-variant-translocated molybdopterin oxidoreductase [Pyrinomonadaceae bacterium]|nr:TAT-variant-translocated molybdopterin oxidoreductase [Pyrinomonadaceae bacterium]
MDNDRHINFKLLRDRVLRSVPPASASGLSPSDQPPATAGGSDKTYWRSLDELADSPVFEEFVQREFPQQAEEWNDPVERRTFLKLMGASLALAGLSGCVIQPPEKVIPYVKQPEEEVPGKGLYFATAFSLGGIATPLLARSNEGRPTKLEGNPDHPNNQGINLNFAFGNDAPSPDDRPYTATDIFSQASILTLYDPDRSQTPLYRGETRPWSQFVAEIRGAIDKEKDGLKAKKGAGLRFLTETITSPTLAVQMKSILTDFPEAKWHQYEPVNRDNARAGAMMAFGQPVNTIYDFSKADRILSLGSDFLSAMPGTLRYARDYAAKRRITSDKAEMNRLYVIESTPTTTGAVADHRFSVKPSDIEALVRDIPEMFVRLKAAIRPETKPRDLLPDPIRSLFTDLLQHWESSIIIVGDEQPPIIHAIAHFWNNELGNVGKTVFYTDPVEANSVDQTQSLRELVNDIDAGKVETLVIIGGNPAYNTPIDLRLDLNRLNKVKLRAHLSLYNNETSELCHWHVPAAHYLESWGDTRSYDGTVTIVQPLIAPLYEGKTAHELLTLFSDNYDRKPYDIVRDYWRTQAGGRVQGVGGSQNELAKPSASPVAEVAGDFESWWRKCLHDGFVPNTALATKAVSLKTDWANSLAGSSPTVREGSNADKMSALPGYELVFRTDPTIYDGRFANNGWLQELPKPLTKLTWDNVALVSANTAKKMGVSPQNYEQDKKGREAYVDTIKLTHRDQTISKNVPVWVMPGQPDDLITVHLGYGRVRAGRVGNDQGFNAYEIRYADEPWFAKGAWVSKTNEQYQLGATQVHFQMEGRDLLRESSLEEFLKDKERLREEAEKQKKELHDLSLYKDFDYQNQGNGYAWGMSIDLNSCVGCNACMIACQSENNIPIVGKEQVIRSREMHWIRVDAYFKGSAEKPEGPFFQPVPCMHCENAPCEPVCPVHATVHSSEGLNDMVYNRCVGTKYCSNNCPYKVRRFNFFLYQDWDTPTYQLMRNPDVSVRSRGVMEKCTYCVQRIQAAKITSELEGRPVRDGEIVTACQSVCPTEAIVFGNINDPNSKVSKLKALERDYSLLGELNTRPRTTYLSALRNPNPEIS